MSRIILMGTRKGKVSPTPSFCRDSSKTHDRDALHPGSSSGRNLMKIFNASAEEYDQEFDRLNVEDYPTFFEIESRYIIFLGHQSVPKQFRRSMQWWTFYKTYILIPHPSGLNRIWNDPGSIDSARSSLELVRNLQSELLA